jgi:hypothetical protein
MIMEASHLYPEGTKERFLKGLGIYIHLTHPLLNTGPEKGFCF